MPSTYTDNGGIELPASGEQSATWGNTVNTNMEILDRITNGVGQLGLSGSSSTLTISDGQVSTGHFKVLELSGSPTNGHVITVAPDNAEHVYIMRNNTSVTVQINQGSGNGSRVNIPGNTTKIVSCAGDGAASNVSDITANLSLGALNIGGTTVTASASELNIMDGVTATTAELNILDGVTATTAELNVLDGIPASLTATELGYVDGVSSAIQTQIDTKAPSASPTLTTPTLGSAITITGGTQSWVATASGVNLTFSYNGTNVMRIDGSGNLTVTGSVNSAGTIS